VIRKEAWSFYRTISGVRLCWELEEPKGPKGTDRPASGLKDPPRDGQARPGTDRPGQARLGTDRPASGRTGPPRDGHARLGADRPASGQTGPPRDRQARLGTDSLLHRAGEERGESRTRMLWSLGLIRDTVRAPYNTISGRDCVKSLRLCLHGTCPQRQARLGTDRPGFESVLGGRGEDVEELLGQRGRPLRLRRGGSNRHFQSP